MYLKSKRKDCKPRTLYLAKLSFKNEGKAMVKLRYYKINKTENCQQNCPIRNMKGNPSGWNKRPLYSNFNPHEDTKMTSRSN